MQGLIRLGRRTARRILLVAVAALVSVSAVAEERASAVPFTIAGELDIGDPGSRMSPRAPAADAFSSAGSWLARKSDRFTLGVLGGVTGCYRLHIPTDDGMPRRVWRSGGYLVASALHYNFKEWFSAFAYYGMLTMDKDSFHQSAGGGVDWRDFFRLAVYAGVDFVEVKALGLQDGWVVGTAITVEGVEFDLGSIL